MREGSDSVHTDDPMKDVTTEHQSPATVPQPAEPVEDQTPPPGFEPQTELAPDQNPGIVERDGVTVDDAAAEENDVSSEDVAKLGTAADDDDEAEDGEPG